jgi:hypothetical protein
LQSLLQMSLGFARLTREREAMPESLPVRTVDVP